MSKLIRDLGEGKSYTLAVSTSSAGVELIAAPRDVPRDRVPLETVTLPTESEVLELVRALGTACREIREHGSTFNAGAFFATRVAEEASQETVRAKDEAMLRERAVIALSRVGNIGVASSSEQIHRILSTALAELVEYLSVALKPNREAELTAAKAWVDVGELDLNASGERATREIAGVVSLSFEQSDRIREIVQRYFIAVMCRAENSIAAWVRAVGWPGWREDVAKAIPTHVWLKKEDWKPILGAIADDDLSAIADWLDARGVDFSHRSELAGSSIDRQANSRASAALRDAAAGVRQGKWREGKKGG